MLHQQYTNAEDTDIRSRFARVIANAASAKQPTTLVQQQRPPMWVDQQRASYDWGYQTGEQAGMQQGIAQGLRMGIWLGFTGALLLALLLTIGAALSGYVTGA